MRAARFLSVFLAAGACLLAGDLAGVKTVYLLPMSSGFDQYLASRLARDGALQVVTDPQKADAIFTDRIGANFEQTLKDLYAPKVKKADTLADAAADDSSRATMQPLSRSRGSLFLVDRQSRLVIWSTYARPKSTSADDLNNLAEKIVAQLDKSRKEKQ